MSIMFTYCSGSELSSPLLAVVYERGMRFLLSQSRPNPALHLTRPRPLF